MYIITHIRLYIDHYVHRSAYSLEKKLTQNRSSRDNICKMLYTGTPSEMVPTY